MTPEQMLEKTSAYLSNLEKAKSGYIAVGLPSEEVGGTVYGDGMTVIRIGAIHEYGSTFRHPGGTPYVVSGGKARFVSKSFVGPVSGITKPHMITIPRRSFLRVPFETKKDDMEKAIVKQFKDVFERGKSAEKALGLIGVSAVNISKGAFLTGGYGEWPDISAATKRRKGSTRILVDNKTLSGSITYVVRGL
jgi:hypothetical protein